jgi:hypothetical protein
MPKIIRMFGVMVFLCGAISLVGYITGHIDMDPHTGWGICLTGMGIWLAMRP